MKILTGAGGGGGGSPTIKPDNLLSDDIVELTLGICEGPIGGLHSGPKSFFLDDTPLVSPSGENNFNPFELHFYHGDVEATPVRNVLGGVTSNTQVGVQLAHTVPVTRTTTGTLRNQIDALEVRILVGSLFRSKSDGDQVENSVRFRIEFRPSGTTLWERFYDDDIEIRGKTTSGYSRDFVVQVPRIDNDWEIRVTKLSSETDPKRSNVISWESFQMTTAEDRAYDNLAVVRVLGQASDQFRGIPNMSGVYAGKLVMVPSNYDPITRYYDGIWDGTFKLAHTDNPAWVVYDLLTNDLYGFRRYYPNLLVNRFSAYEWGKWCDELVPRPGGGYQPRWTYNDQTTQTRSGKEMLYYICGAAGAMPVEDFNGTVSFKIDKPTTPAQVFGIESATAAGFSYQFTPIEQRPNDISVKFVNPNLDWNQDVRRVADQDRIDAVGRIHEELVAVGCNDVYEAQRRAFRRLVQANTETLTVSFTTTRAAMQLEPFDVIGVTDPQMGWGISGRLKGRDETTLFLRDPLFLPVDQDLTLQVTTPSGVSEVTVQTSQPNTTELTITAGTWPLDAPEQAQFAISSTELGLVKPFRILSIKEDEQSSEALQITALELNVNKYGDIDNLTSSGVVEYNFRQSGFPSSPNLTSVQSGEGIYIQNEDGTIFPRVLVEWEETKLDATITSYDVRAREIETGEVISQNSVTRKTYLTGLRIGSEYWIDVVAINDRNNRSVPSNSISHTVLGKSGVPTLPTPWVGVPGVGSISLQGPEAEIVDFSHFKVYRYDSDDDQIGPADTFTATVYTRQVPEDDTTSAYRVSLVDRSGNESALSTPIAVFPRPVEREDLAQVIRDQIDTSESQANAAAAQAAQALEDAQSVQTDLEQTQSDLVDSLGSLQIDYSAAAQAVQDAETAQELSQRASDRARHAMVGLLNPGFEAVGIPDVSGVPAGWLAKSSNIEAFSDGRLTTTTMVPPNSAHGSDLSFGTMLSDIAWWAVGQRVLAEPGQVFDLGFRFLFTNETPNWTDDDDTIGENDYLVEANWYDENNTLLSTDVSLSVENQRRRANVNPPATNIWLAHTERMTAPENAAYLEFYIICSDNSGNVFPGGRQEYATAGGVNRSASGLIDDVQLQSSNGTVLATTSDTAQASQHRLAAATSENAANSAASATIQGAAQAVTIFDDITTLAQTVENDRQLVQTLKGQAETASESAAQSLENSEGVLTSVQQSERSSVRAAARVNPMGFDEDGLFWTRTLSGPPAERSPLTNVTFVSTDRGRVAQLDAGITSNVLVSPLAYTQVRPNRSYRCTVQARHTGFLLPGAGLRIQSRALDGSYLTTTTTTRGYDFVDEDTWVEFVQEFNSGADPDPYLLFIVYKPSSYVNPNASVDLSTILIEDITDIALAQGSAEASQTFSLDSLAFAGEASASASVAQTAVVDAETEVGKAQQIQQDLLDVQQDINGVRTELLSTESNVVTTAAAVDYAVASVTPSIPRLPAAAWTNLSMSANLLVRDPADTAGFVTDDEEFGFAYRFTNTFNQTFGPSAGVRFNPEVVYEIEVLFRVVEDDPSDDVEVRLGVASYKNMAPVQTNIQTDTEFFSSVSDGVRRARIWVSERDLSTITSDLKPQNVLHVPTTGGNLLYPFIRQNSQGRTQGRVSVGTINVRDVTGTVDALLQAQQAGIFRADALQAANEASGYASSAQTSLELVSSVSEQGAGVLARPLLEAPGPGTYNRWRGEGDLTVTPNSVYPSGYDLNFNIDTAAELDGITFESTDPVWSGVANPVAFMVEIDFTLNSGTLDGSGFICDWVTDLDNFRSVLELKGMNLSGSAGSVQRASGFLIRPNDSAGVFELNRAWLFANYQGNGFTPGAKDITFHRLFIRPARLEELGQGIIAEQVVSTLTNNYYTISQVNSAITSEVTSQVSTITGGTFEQLTSQILNDYLTSTQIDSTVAAALTTFESELQGPTGAIGTITANLTQNYYTQAQVDAGIGNAVAGVELRLGGKSGTTYGAIEDIKSLDLDPNSALMQSFSTIQASITSTDDELDALLSTQAGALQVVLTTADQLVQGEAVTVEQGGAALNLPGSIRISENSTARATGGTTNGAYFSIGLDRSAQFSGQRIRIDVLARKAAVNPSTGFSVTYSTSDNGNSGSLSAAVIDDNQWHWYSFFYDRPVINNTTPDYFAIFPDDAKTGGALEVSRVILRAAIDANELPELSTLQGSITDIQALDLDKLSGTGIATLLQQLELQSDGTSAAVQDFATAKVDLDGFAAAFTGVTAEVSGGKVAGFKATSFSDPDGTSGATLELLGDVVAEGSLATNKLTVGLQQNLLGDSRNMSLTHPRWFERHVRDAGDETTFAYRNPELAYSGVDHPVLELRQQGVSTDGYSDLQYQHLLNTDGDFSVGVPVNRYETYSLSARVLALRCDVEMRIRWYNVAGQTISFSRWVRAENTLPDNQPVQEWSLVFLIEQPPADAVFAAPHFRKLATQGGTNSYAFVDEVMFASTHAEAKAPTPFSPPGTVLVENGNLMADSVTAREANFESLAALNLKVGSADIEEASIGIAQITDVLETDNYEEDANGLPLSGWSIPKQGQPKFANAIISRPLVVAEGEYEAAGRTRIQSGSVTSGSLYPDYLQWEWDDVAWKERTYLINTGILLPESDGFWEPRNASFTGSAFVMPEPDTYIYKFRDAGGSPFLGCESTVFPTLDVETGEYALHLKILMRTWNVVAVNGHPSSDESTIPFKIRWMIKKVT